MNVLISPDSLSGKVVTEEQKIELTKGEEGVRLY